MDHIKSITFLSIALTVLSCQQSQQEKVSEPQVEEVNPAAPGFDTSSHPQAIALADQVMEAMGGRKSWDDTRYIFWNFFGARTLLWDKFTGDVRIEFLNRDMKILVNEKTGEGKVQKNGLQFVNPDSITFYSDMGKSVWINDSYWLVMPFKLKDSGVSLSYLGKDTTEAGESSEVIRLTFEEVGNTPENAYNVWVSEESKLVKQWAWYQNATDSVPRFTRPWDNYVQMGGILLSDERGSRDLSEVRVFDEVPEGIFESFDVTL